LFQFSLSLSNIWLRYNKKPKGVFFMKHSVNVETFNLLTVNCLLTGLKLESEFPVQDLKSGQGGLLQVCMEGIGLLFANTKVCIVQ